MDRDNQSHLNSTKVKKEKKKNNLLINACWISHCAGEYLKRKPDIFSSAFSNLFVSWYRRESAKRDSGLFSIKKLGVKKKKNSQKTQLREPEGCGKVDPWGQEGCQEGTRQTGYSRGCLTHHHAAQPYLWPGTGSSRNT